MRKISLQNLHFCKNFRIFVSGILCTHYTRNEIKDMKALFLLIAFYTISGKQAVPSGDVPEGASCSYTQTGNNSGQMTAGNTIDLSLQGYDGCRLQSVTLTMRSNKSSGAGALEMTMGKSLLWTIADAAFSDAGWNGAYSTDWEEVSHFLDGVVVPDKESINLHIQASANSLYLQSVTLNYTAAQPRAYTVSFSTHVPVSVSALTESQPGMGVILPDVPLVDDAWDFLGWADQPLPGSDEPSTYFRAGTRIYPTTDCTLHAIYKKHVEREVWLPADSIVSGDYLITMCLLDNSVIYQATGNVNSSGALASKSFNFYNMVEDPVPFQAQFLPEDVYTITMLTDSTLSIRHTATNSLVALGNGKFVKTASGLNWNIRSRYDSITDMTFYTLWGEYGFRYEISIYPVNDVVVFKPVKNPQGSPGLLLYAIADYEALVADAPYYTSYPYGVDALSANYSDQIPAYRLPLGPCTLLIQNGQKTLQINE